MSPSPSPRASHSHETDVEAHAKGPGLSYNKDATVGSFAMSPELFEKLYLTPKVPSAAQGVKHFANPTPLGLMGFVISTFTFSMILMGWGGATGFSPVVGIFFFVGPILLLAGMIFEWIMGNFFTMMSMGLFAVFWLAFGMMQLPTLGLASSYADGATSESYNTVIALFLIVWGFAFFTFFIFSLKTNVIFAGIFFFAMIAVWILSGAYFKTGSGDYTLAGHLQTAGGALLFVVAILGWYIVVVIMSFEMRMGINFPLGDLSHLWPSNNAEIGDEEKQK
ncbi:hypothetical protein KC340_g10979 [Hortaea werneckii]|nr:hypothetical protein KC342_g11209 [Hortaea werneckii]KAI7099651.1 hypothetical protein KC339_g8054 [Hortaea werneckii]KAI7229977.1 hypothetical protein KC365_g7820 [Hortaea werneckii]KAI7308673.1 hypothetical protein KC340_g10979 [Hortaea werneckii]KAI7362442.1 hypothetical protein KC354_g7272 [Hortaea werneckii]